MIRQPAPGAPCLSRTGADFANQVALRREFGSDPMQLSRANRRDPTRAYRGCARSSRPSRSALTPPTRRSRVEGPLGGPTLRAPTRRRLCHQRHTSGSYQALIGRLRACSRCDRTDSPSCHRRCHADPAGCRHGRSGRSDGRRVEPRRAPLRPARPSGREGHNPAPRHRGCDPVGRPDRLSVALPAGSLPGLAGRLEPVSALARQGRLGGCDAGTGA